MAKKTSTAGRIAIAIAKLENKSEMPDSTLVELRSRMQQCIAGTMRFYVQDRENLKALLQEQALAVAGIANSEGAEVPAATKVEYAPYIVLGTVQSCRTDHSALKTDGARYAISKSTIELLMKLVNCRTGSIVATKTVQGMGRAIEADNSKPSTGLGMRDAIDEACHAVAYWLRDNFACPPKVLKIYEGEITVDLNENEVEEGDVFDVVDAKDLGKDEDTGAWLGFDGKTIGSVAITRTGLRTSNAIPLEGESLSLENLDISNHTYMLRRVSKDSLKKRLRRKFANEH